jgi:hypothetical protein
MTFHYTKKEIPLRAITLSKNDLKRIVERLQEALEEEANLQVSQLACPADTDREEWQRQIEQEKLQAFQITVTIQGDDGQDFFGYGADIFDSPNIPDNISLVYLTNRTAFRSVTGRNPGNSFALTLDFSKPPLVDNNNPVSSPTPNDSKLLIEGDRDSWVASVQKSVTDIINRRENYRRYLHRGFVYDIGLMLLALPLGIYMCWRLSDMIFSEIGRGNTFLASVAYVYIILAFLWAYGIMFGYTKWAFPTVELAETKSKSKSHRRFWYAITVAICGTLIAEILI